MKNLKLGIIAFLSVALFIRLAMSYTLQWYSNPESDIAGYRMWEAAGSPRTYTLLVTTNPSPSPTINPSPPPTTVLRQPIPLPTPTGTPRFIVLTAFNISGLESAKSAEIAIVATPTPTPAPPTAPTGLTLLP